MKEFSKAFYQSVAWKKCRASYLNKVYGLCERCNSLGKITPAKIVHHKVYLNEKNISDVTVTLNHDNLEALCQDCHNFEHMSTDATREDVMFDELGNLVKRHTT